MIVDEAVRSADAKIWDLLAVELGGRGEAERLGLAVHAQRRRSDAYEWTVRLGARHAAVSISRSSVDDTADACLGELVMRHFHEVLKRLRAA